MAARRPLGTRTPTANATTVGGKAIPRAELNPDNPFNADLATGEQSALLDWMTWEHHNDPRYTLAEGFKVGDDGQVVPKEPNWFSRHYWQIWGAYMTALGLYGVAQGIGAGANIAANTGGATAAGTGIGETGAVSGLAGSGFGGAAASNAGIGLGSADFAATATAPATASTLPGAAVAGGGIVGPGMANYYGGQQNTPNAPSNKTLGIPNSIWPYILQLGGSALSGALAPDPFQRREGFPNAVQTQQDIGDTIKSLLASATAKSQEPIRLEHAGVLGAPQGYSGPSLPMRIGLNTPVPGYLQNPSTATATATAPGTRTSPVVPQTPGVPKSPARPIIDPQGYGAAQLLLHALNPARDLGGVV